MPQFISAAEARELGLPRYFTGKPCKYNHIAERNVKDNTCCACRGIYNSKTYREDKTTLTGIDTIAPKDTAMNRLLMRKW